MLKVQPQPLAPLQFAKFSDAKAYLTSEEDKVPYDELVWDRKKQYGQIRALNVGIVNYYYQQLLAKGPPATPPIVPLKRLPSMNNFNLNVVICVSFSLSTGGKYCPLGGQHISSALLMLRRRNLQSTPEDALPDSLRFVRGPIYSTDTPLHICRAIAGHHQATQHDVRESSMADICQFFMEMSQQKFQSTGSSFLADEDIYNSLVTFGLVRGSEKSLLKTSESMSLKEATLIERSQVWKSVRGNPRMIFSFFSFTEDEHHPTVEKSGPDGVCKPGQAASTD